MANLLIETGAKKGLLLHLPGDKVVIGRDPYQCDLTLDGNMLAQEGEEAKRRISRKHAILRVLEGTYYIEDGDGKGGRSRNGVLINGKAIPFPGRTLLRHCDRITICDFSCTFLEECLLGPAPETLLPPLPTRSGKELSSSVESSIKSQTNLQFLETQPAEKLKIILDISNRLSKTLELDALLPRIVEDLFQLFKQADRGFILFRQEGSNQLVPRVFKTRRESASPDHRFSASLVQKCLDQGQAILGNDVVQQFQENPSVASLPIRSLICAPLQGQDGQPIGVIQLDTQDPNQKFSHDDLTLLLGIAGQASIALCNARLYRDSLVNQRRQRDLELASKVQLALLPQKLPRVKGYNFYACYEPAMEVGGDYYDFVPLPGDRLGVLLGDAAGKGVAAALIMVKFTVEARHCLHNEPDLAAAMTRLNGAILEGNLAEHFVTLAAGILDPRAHTVTLVVAGHPVPLICRQATGTLEEAVPENLRGTAIGMFENQVYSSYQARLEPGDRLVVFSDGVIDAMDAQEEPFGLNRVHALLQGEPLTPQATGQRLLQAIRQHAAGCSQQDDIALICLGRSLV